MDHIPFKELLKSMPLAMRKKASMLIVRELEREQPNSPNFICFVDDGEDSYDVQTVMDKEEMVQSLSCDCPAHDDVVCLHKVAMALALKQMLKEEKDSKKKSSTTNPFKKMLQNIDRADLEDWLVAMMKKEKFIKESFIIKFSPQIVDTNINPIQVTQRLDEIIKSVAGRRRKLVSTEGTKMRHLLDQYADPYIDAYIEDPTNTKLEPIVSAIISHYMVLIYFFNTASAFIKWYEPKIIKIIQASLSVTDAKGAKSAKQNLKSIFKKTIFTKIYNHEMSTALENLLESRPHESFASFLQDEFPDKLSFIFRRPYDSETFITPYLENGGNINPFVKDIALCGSWHAHNVALAALYKDEKDSKYAWEIMVSIKNNFRKKLFEFPELRAVFEQLSLKHEAPEQRAYKGFMRDFNYVKRVDYSQNYQSKKNKQIDVIHNPSLGIMHQLSHIAKALENNSDYDEVDRFDRDWELVLDKLMDDVDNKRTNLKMYDELIKDLAPLADNDFDHKIIFKTFEIANKDKVNKHFIEALIYKIDNDDRRNCLIRIYHKVNNA